MVPVVSTAHPRMICAAGHLLRPSKGREPTNSVTCDIFSGPEGGIGQLLWSDGLPRSLLLTTSLRYHNVIRLYR